jgi:DNA polymerase I-like protein with 3'-5' exonuclease and polymerase domains
MNYVLTLDFETHDPYLKTMGPGWAYGMLEELCVGYKINNEETKIAKNSLEIIDIIDKANVIIAHNAQYDLGIVWSQLNDKINLNNKIFVDTVIMAKLYNNIENGYSLNELSGKYLRRAKLNSSLGDAVLEYKLINCKDPNTKLSKTKAENWSKLHMKELYEVASKEVELYCQMDVDLCKGLYDYYLPNIKNDHILQFSSLLKILIKSRIRGVTVNSEKLFDIKAKLQHKRNTILDELIMESGNKDFNPLSTVDITQVLLKTMPDLPKTAKGNISIVSKWLDEQDNSICKKIVEYRILEKLSRDFCDNILKMQSILPEKYKGKIYPTFNLLGAETGRMSSKGPNLQQIPNAKKHKELGTLIRDSYEVRPGKLWASIDYSAQEPRLQVHYASLINAEGANLLVTEYNKNPNLDLHEMVANLTGTSRNESKTINLGLSYGMGISKLAKSLSLTMYQAKLLLEQFHLKLPYLKELNEKCKNNLKKNKYIKTIGSRLLKLDKPWINPEDGKEKTFEYKALNKLIQGSASDQIMMALLELDKQGFTVISSIHDEVNLEVSNVQEALQAKKIMENVLKLRVPVVAELKLGTTWGNGVLVDDNGNEVK